MSKLNDAEVRMMIDDIFENVVDAREQIQTKKGYEKINGACHENAIYLCEYLIENTEYIPHIRWGLVDYYGKTYENLKSAEHDGVVHFWVEINISDDLWVLADIFTMESPPDDINRGQVFVSDERPELYETLDNTLFEYKENIINPDEMLNFIHYRKLKNKIKPVK